MGKEPTSSSPGEKKEEQQKELSGSVHVVNEKGLHTRTSTALAKLAQEFGSEVKVVVEGNAVNAKSVLSLLTLGAKKGQKLDIRVKGEDQEKAFGAIVKLIQSGFEGVEP